MAIVAGVDFGTLSVRLTLVDTAKGRLGSGVAAYPLRRKKDDPDYATQSHEDHMRALAEATRQALASTRVPGDQVAALAIDTTGSSVIPVGKNFQPLNEYYLWCDHRASQRRPHSAGSASHRHNCTGKLMKLTSLRAQVLDANLELVRRGLVLYTFGNASGISREEGLVVIKPSGVPYETMKPDDLVVVDLLGKTIEGHLKPSSDLATHFALYKAFPAIGGVAHTHSRAATSWAQA
jgi:Class II Aldolase and Adducin N-terminal domain/FGGY family of carbohydrate kinases, N-terminal domain